MVDFGDPIGQRVGGSLLFRRADEGAVANSNNTRRSTFNTKGEAESYNGLLPAYVELLSYVSLDQGGGGFYYPVAAEPVHKGKVQVVGQWYELRCELDRISTTQFGALISDADQTEIVQDALDYIEARRGNPEIGGKVWNDRGIKFVKDNLALPMRSSVLHWEDDDLSPWNEAIRATNEFVEFTNQANPSGLNSEIWFASQLHPGLVLHLDNQSPSHNFLGPGQTIVPTVSNPVRASYNILHSRWNTWTAKYVNFAKTNLYDGVFIGTTCRLITLLGMGTSSWLIAPIPGGILRGLDSGAILEVKSIDADSVTGFWKHGVFRVGERCQYVQNIGEIDEAIYEVTAVTHVITGRIFEPVINNMIHQDMTLGAIGFGLGSGELRQAFGFAGDIVRTRFHGFGQNCPAPFNPDWITEWLVQDPYTDTPRGLMTVLDLSQPDSKLRKMIHRAGEVTPVCQIGGIFAHFQYRVAGGIVGEALHIASCTPDTPNPYQHTVVFSHPTKSLHYRVLPSVEGDDDFITVDISGQTTGGFTWWCRDRDGVPKYPTYAVSFVIIGGDTVS